jgi:hypothetical protein
MAVHMVTAMYHGHRSGEGAMETEGHHESYNYWIHAIHPQIIH